jgi:hypothetical protein
MAALLKRAKSLIILMIMDVAPQSRQDPQFVEIFGRHYLITEIMRAGIEVAVPVRDRGIDLVAYVDLDSSTKPFCARPIQLKANWETGFAFDRKYEKFHDLVVAYVWHLNDPPRTATYALTWQEISVMASDAGLGVEAGGRWAITKPGKDLTSRLEAFRMTREKWRTKMVGAGNLSPSR